MALAPMAGFAAPAPAPAWAAELPGQEPAGGISGRACQATPVGGGQALIPSHCLARSGAGSGRDYEFAPWTQGAEARVLARGDLARQTRSPGDRVWVRAPGGWIRARVLLASGPEYWIESVEGPFCPGDSGSQAWASEGGAWRLVGMVVSGGYPDMPGMCSRRAVALKREAIDWPWGR